MSRLFVRLEGRVDRLEGKVDDLTREVSEMSGELRGRFAARAAQ